MSTKAAVALGLPPGLNFRPDDDELVEFFLLPTVRGEPAWFPGVIVIDDDSAANTLPWKLLERHGLADDDEAYFFVRTKDAKQEAARQDRYCAGGASARWVSQRPVFSASCIGGETIEWRRINLNLQMGRGKSGGGSGSTGWVMHEYTLTEPACPSLKICHVSFSGHGKDRKRVPDEEYSNGCHAAEPAPKRARVDADAAAANSGSSTCVYGSTEPAIDQGYGAEHGSGDVFLQRTGEPWCYSGVFSVPDAHNDCQGGDPSVAHASAGQQEHSPSPFLIDQGISATDQQQQLLPDDNNAANDSSSATTCAYDYEPMQTTDEEIMEWGSLLADDAEPTAEQQKTEEHAMTPQLMIQETVAAGAAESSDGISPSNQQQQQLDSVPSMEVEERQEIQEDQLQLVQSSSTGPLAESAGAELYLEQGVPTTEQHLPAEYQNGGDDRQEQREFWRSLGVDIEKIVC
ncbi:hypothetical protein PAHAL_1G130900 [Panicum hallii]|jgi:hypothetical protein|uniref:NAC domain-containing protein n=1 Tax=Panicum hallii TaxID=206008 RepID=A0A2T8KV33_9POAL|nr:hypothetical protein PAHAL_1G130900 [Panicum hallii]